jgi:DNA replication protein DnaC
MVALCTVDLLIIDDFALEPMSREESRDIYQLFVERNPRCQDSCRLRLMTSGA